MARALKVYKIPIGFHDAYVAAPTQKAAIEAWGSDKDVFQRKQAELVTDPELTKAPLESPGKVIKRLRGTAAERSEEHTSELQSLMRISYAVFCLKKKNTTQLS